MLQSEKNFKKWLKATGQEAPTKQDLMFIRSLELEPKRIGANLWQTVSANRPGVAYTQEVFFKGYKDDGILGFDLLVTCDCPATGECKHRLRIFRLYESDHQFVFDLFNLPKEARYGDLYKAAAETFEGIKKAQPRVLEFGFTGICALCGKASRNGSEHPACEREEKYYSEAA
jgi:hypothetical protein